MNNTRLRNEEWDIFICLVKLMKPYKFWVALCGICALIIGGCDIISVSLIAKLIDGIHDNDSKGAVKLIIYISGVMLMGILASYLMPYSSGRVGNFAIRDLRSKIVKHYDRVLVSIKDRMHSGDITSRLNNDITAVEKLFVNVSDYIYTPLIVTAVFTYLFTIQWKLVLISFLSIPFALFISHKLSRPMGKYNEEYYRYLGEANNIMQDALSGISVLKAYNLQEIFHARYADKLNKSLEIFDKRINSRSTLLMPIMFMVYEFPYVVCAAYGGYLAVDGSLTASGLVSFILLLRFIVNPASQLPRLIMNAKSAAGAGKRLFELLLLETEREDGNTSIDEKNDSAIEFKQVVFGYEQNKEVLKNLSFQVTKGENAAFVGASGCGKSTIINLICGFYQAYKGSISINGKQIENWNLPSLREQIGIVTQDTYLYPGSIEENIKFGKEHATHEEIINAAKEANAHEFIMEFKEGYGTLVGERGTRLSGGQKQRIAIARAILKDAPILLLDEPTSALDTESELLVQQSLEQLSQNRTVITITHRLTTIKNVSTIFVLDNGRIRESGSHKELLTTGKIYRELYQRQFLEEEMGEYESHNKKEEIK